MIHNKIDPVVPAADMPVGGAMEGENADNIY
jgi:hypothetical protein